MSYTERTNLAKSLPYLYGYYLGISGKPMVQGYPDIWNEHETGYLDGEGDRDRGATELDIIKAYNQWKKVFDEVMKYAVRNAGNEPG